MVLFVLHMAHVIITYNMVCYFNITFVAKKICQVNLSVFYLKAT